MTLNPTQVQEIGEQGLLALVQRYCPTQIVGDDAALLSLPIGQQLVVTTDILVDGVHFSDRTMSPMDIGWKAAAANLSDLAAMGATPLGLTVGLALPPQQLITWVDQVYQGLTACLAHHPIPPIPHPLPSPIPILGGDISRSSVASLSITALGSVIPDQAILRSQAQPGDVIVTTGLHGASKAGLELLLNPDSGLKFPESAAQALIQAHQRPMPRLDISARLFSCWQSLAWEQPYRIAGMDSSDGLSDAIVQICQASQVGARIQAEALPIPQSFQTALPRSQALEWCLSGGEDYQLVLTMPPRLAAALHQLIPNDLWILGEITADIAVLLVEKGETRPLHLSQGFQHFSSGS